MQVTYRGELHDVLGYIRTSRKLVLRRTGDPGARRRYVNVSYRVRGLTREMREQLGIPVPVMPRWVSQQLNREPSSTYFQKDPIIDTEA